MLIVLITILNVLDYLYFLKFFTQLNFGNHDAVLLWHVSFWFALEFCAVVNKFGSAG